MEDLIVEELEEEKSVVCMVCGRLLTDTVSVAREMGPVCAARSLGALPMRGKKTKRLHWFLIEEEDNVNV